MPFRWMLFAGIALMIVGVVVAVYRAFGVIPCERLAGAVVLGAIVAFAGGEMSGHGLLLIIDVVFVALLIAENLRVERMSAPTTDA